MLRVWTASQPAGALDRLRERGSSFAYAPEAPRGAAVSLTMPVRIASWNTDFGLAPIFEMNLPEGALRERLTRRFAKALGRFDDFDLLGVVGRSQIGRLRYSGMKEDLAEDVPFQSVDELLRARREGGLFDYLLTTFEIHSGISGIQPKVMIRDDTRPSARQTSATRVRDVSVRGATHIVKFWNADDYPELAANEFFCLRVARSVRLSVPNFELADDGSVLIVERFDRQADGCYSGFEDFCVLNGQPTAQKYNGGYETKLFRRMNDFIAPNRRSEDAATAFRLFVLNCALRNGDAHLKNFAVLYDDPLGETVRLAPVYDVVTTAAYLPNDRMALTLDGRPDWPNRKQLVKLGQTRADLSTARIREIFENTADAMAQVAVEVKDYFKNSKYPDVGKRMLAAWQQGMAESLEIQGGSAS
jgi:serine/threonine-protein kinase HipA